MAKDREQHHEVCAQSAERAAAKAKDAGNDAVSAFMLKVARAHRQVAK